MKRIENIYEVTQRLCGVIEPEGETSIDQVRLRNLEDTISLAQHLIDDIMLVSRHRERHEASMKTSGERAYTFIVDLKEMLP